MRGGGGVALKLGGGRGNVEVGRKAGRHWGGEEGGAEDGAEGREASGRSGEVGNGVVQWRWGGWRVNDGWE